MGACFFVTFRLFGSLPREVLKKLKIESENKLKKLSEIPDEKERNYKVFNLRKEYFGKVDGFLENYKKGPHHLRNQVIMDIVINELMRFDNSLYDLLAYSIMSNHVHVLIDTSLQINKTNDSELSEKYVQLDQIMKRIKGPTAVYCNRELGLSGKFWARESYDMYIRNEKMLNNVLKYILNNPVKAGLVEDWEDYRGNYLKPNR